MPTLAEEIQFPKSTLDEFYDITIKILNYIPAVLSEETTDRGYILYSSETAGTKKFVRPIQKTLFISSPHIFSDKANQFLKILEELKNKRIGGISNDKCRIIDSVVYTIQQSIGTGLDLLVNPNSARKHVGNRFEELIRLIITSLGLANKKIVFKIPYVTEGGKKYYSCETDIVVSPFESVKSNTRSIHPDEVLISTKTTSKDRMGKIFLDKMLMQSFSKQPDIKIIGIFLNDVQRATRKDGSTKISYTLVSGLFMVYTKFLTALRGVYFLDPPPNAKIDPLKNYIFPFSQFLSKDIWEILGLTS